jgi:hypothetical protein
VESCFKVRDVGDKANMGGPFFSPSRGSILPPAEVEIQQTFRRLVVVLISVLTCGIWCHVD